MKAGLLRTLNFVPTPDRLRVAYFLLYLLAGMGLISAVLEARAGNWTVAGVAIAGVLLAPAVFIATHITRSLYLPLYAALIFMTVVFHIGAFTQHHHPGNFVWYSIYPIVWFSLAGLRAGAALSLLGIVSWVTGWFVFPFLSDQSRVSGDIFAQAVAAYLTTTIFAFIYERSRTHQERQLKELALSDFLTGALNRRGFVEIANAVLDEGRRFEQPCSVALFDIDHFKTVNDTYGHEAGDKLLQDIVALTNQHMRRVDKLARWGGEEFIVLLPHTSLSGAQTWAEKLREIIASHRPAHDQPVTASFGIATQMADDTLDDIIRRADESLYQAKKDGRNRVVALPG